MQSSLAKCQPCTPMSEVELFHKKKEAWLIDNILVITQEQLVKLSNKEYEIIITIGNRLYKGIK